VVKVDATRLAATSPNQLKKLPLFDRKEWTAVRFGAVVRMLKEQVDPVAEGVERFVAGEHMETENVHIRKWGNVGDGYLGPAFIRRFRKGQVLYGSRRTYLKKVALAEWDGVTANTTFVLEAVEGMLLQELLPWLMLSERFTMHSIQESKGSTNPYINFPDIAKFEFALPPLEQQRRISEILWAVDQASETYSSLMVDLAKARRAQIDELIPAPEIATNKIQFVRLDKVASMQNGRPFPSAEYQESGVRLIRPGNLAPDGSLDWSSSATVCLPDHQRKRNFSWLIGPDQVLINLTAQSLEDGFIGRACFTREGDEGLLNQRIGRFVLSKDVLPRFFFRCLQTTRFRSVVENRCEGSKIRHLYFRHFDDFALPVLTKDQQNGISEALEASDMALAGTTKHIEHLVDLRQSLASSILD